MGAVAFPHTDRTVGAKHVSFASSPALRSREMKILIISDNRPGHYNQSLGIVSQIKDAEYDVIAVKFRSKRRDNLLRITMLCLGWLPMRRRLIARFLKMALASESVSEILKCARSTLPLLRPYDAVLSTGSSVAPINLLVGKLLKAKTVVCTRPSPLGFAYFDLAILPQHHWQNRKNVCQTLGVPNKIDPEAIKKRGRELQGELKLPDKTRIGVLLGGTDRYYTITTETATNLLDTLLRVCDKIDGQIALTTSRRTPPEVEELVYTQLASDKRCVLLALAHKGTEIFDPVGAIFAISDIIIVTEDSFSMVCEAASSGRKVVILRVDRQSRRLPRRIRTYSSIAQVAPVVTCDVENLADTLLKLNEEDVKHEALRDAETAAKAIIGMLS